METLFESDDLRVLFQEGGEHETWVSFSALGSPVPAAKGFIEGRGASAVFFIGSAPDWYLSAEIDAAIAAAKTKLRGKVIAFGGSMGGFAALRYAKAIKADVVIAGGPQVVLDASCDVRWGGLLENPRHRRRAFGYADDGLYRRAVRS